MQEIVKGVSTPFLRTAPDFIVPRKVSDPPHQNLITPMTVSVLPPQFLSAMSELYSFSETLNTGF